MDIPNLGANFSMMREQLLLFVLLLFALPLISFVAIKLWIAARANKTQRTSNWFVPDDLKSEAARIHYSLGGNHVAVSHTRNSSIPAMERNGRTRRSA